MPLQKILFKPGVNRENTRYTTEGGWYECDKVRFRQGNPEVIGGWARTSIYTFLGVCRSLWNWITLAGANLLGVGTNLKFYIELGGNYYDVTPIRATSTINANPFAGNGTTTVTVTDTAHGGATGDFVTFSGATGTYASTFNAEFQITVLTANTYTITTGSAIAAGNYGGSSVVAAYQIAVGPAIQAPLLGWGAGGWGLGTWGNGASTSVSIQLWSQMNYGEDLVFGPRGGGIYYWDASGGVATRGVALNTLGGTVTFTNASPTVVTSTILYTEGAALQFSGASLPTGITAGTTYYVFQVDGLTFNLLDGSGAEVNTASSGSGAVSLIVDVPVVQNTLTVSDSSRFVMVFGTNDYGSSTIDPMLIRWSAQDDVYNWTPDATNQAGFTRLSHGSEIITTIQARQEIVVFTDSSVYSLQYLGPPYVWAPQLLGDNISIQGPNAAVIASGIVYWMGVDKFYAYDGRVQTLNCDLRRYVFQDLNQDQNEQIFAGTNEGFNEVWWFYCSAGSNTVDRYVVYNYLEKIWYYGTMGRTAWIDAGLNQYPIAATYNQNLVFHESGVVDGEGPVDLPIYSYIISSQFDIGDGHNFAFVWRMLPDLTFRGSDPNVTPQVTMSLLPLQNSGSGYTVPPSVGGSNSYPVVRIGSYAVDQFTGQINTRIRARQMSMKIESNTLGTQWQLGYPRLDLRQDGRR